MAPHKPTPLRRPAVSNKKRLAIGVAICVSLLASCLQKKDRAAASKDTNLTPTADSDVSLLLDANEAEVSATVTDVTSEAFGRGYKLPSFKMTYKGANYVQILRCDETYRSLLDGRIERAKKSPGIDSLELIWRDSFGQQTYCQIAANFYVPLSFQDVGAKNGTFFYLIRPCILAQYSSSKKNECGSNLAVSKSIDYKDSPSDILLTKMAAIRDAEAEYDAVLAKLYALSATLIANKDRCQELSDLEYKSQMQSIKSSLDHDFWQIVGTTVGVGATVGARALLTDSNLRSAGTALGLKTKRYSGVAGEFMKLGLSAVVFTAAIVITDEYAGAVTKAEDYGSKRFCDAVKDISAQIVKIKNDKLVEQAEEKLVSKSSEIKTDFDFFEGYTDDTFGPSGKEPSATKAQ